MRIIWAISPVSRRDCGGLSAVSDQEYISNRPSKCRSLYHDASVHWLIGHRLGKFHLPISYFKNIFPLCWSWKIDPLLCGSSRWKLSYQHPSAMEMKPDQRSAFGGQCSLNPCPGWSIRGHRWSIQSLPAPPRQWPLNLSFQSKTSWVWISHFLTSSLISSYSLLIDDSMD